MFSITAKYQKELEEIKENLQQEITFKNATFSDLIEIDFDELDRNACSLIVLTVNSVLGGCSQKAIGLAKVIQYIFIADQVHRLISDDPNLSEEKRQFPVLVGDFLFGKFFQELCKEKLLHFLHPLAKVIGGMNEGSISRLLLNEKGKADTNELLKVLDMERANLTGIAARLSAEMAGGSEKVQQQFEELGRHLGLAWAAAQNHLEGSIIRGYLTKAREIIINLSGVKDHKLNELVDYMEVNLQRA